MSFAARRTDSDQSKLLSGAGSRRGAEFLPSRSPGALRKPDCADAEHEPRGAAGRLGSDKAAVRGRERARSGFSTLREPGSATQADCAVAEHELRGAEDRLGSVKAAVRGREQARSGVSTLREPWVHNTSLTAPTQSMSLAAQRADSDRTKLPSGSGSGHGAGSLPFGSPGAQRKLTAPSQCMSLAARRTDSDQSKLRSGAGSRRGADIYPPGALVCKASRPRCRRARASQRGGQTQSRITRVFVKQGSGPGGRN